MSYNEKQKKYINDLLERLNFDLTNHSFMYKYLELLMKTYVLFRSIGNCEKIEITYKNQKRYIPKNYIFNEGYTEKEMLFELNSFSLITYLKLEINIKKRKLYNVKPVNNLNIITATDVANYTFCPVSYSISKSIYYRTLDSARIGEKNHKDSLIYNILKNIKSKIKEQVSIENAEIETHENFSKLSELLNGFEIIFSGHSKEQKDKIFKNGKGNYYGQPDFILKNNSTNEIIVIEEKYQFIPKEFRSFGNDGYYNDLEKEINAKRDNDFFYDNHLNQIGSYLFGISEYNIDYGILIYWKYEIIDSQQIIKKCIFKKINKTSKLRFNLNEIYKKIIYLKKNREIKFDVTNRNPAKCASCVNNFLCGHKTGKYNRLQFPYNLEDLKLNEVNLSKDFQIDIKKKNVNNIETLLDNIYKVQDLDEEITA